MGWSCYSCYDNIKVNDDNNSSSSGSGSTGKLNHDDDDDDVKKKIRKDDLKRVKRRAITTKASTTGRMALNYLMPLLGVVIKVVIKTEAAIRGSSELPLQLIKQDRN